jgi:hypothetical protein
MNETKNQNCKKIFEVEMNLVHSYEKKSNEKNMQRNVLTGMFLGQSLFGKRERRDKTSDQRTKKEKTGERKRGEKDAERGEIEKFM